MIRPSESAAIVLAAGSSRRMGRFKPLLPLGGRPMIHWCVDLFSACGVSEIHVVTGHRHEALAPVLVDLGVETVVNRDFEQGMFSSVKAGIRSLSPDCGAFFILPVDIPLVRPATVRQLLERFHAGNAKVVIPCFGGHPGHPPLIARSLAAPVLAADGAGGLRAVLARWPTETVREPVPDRFILQDADSPGDHQALDAACRRRAFPADDECDAILAGLGPGADGIIGHGREVARVAEILTSALQQAKVPLDAQLVRAAARLHDLAKGTPDHARVGAERLRGLGFDPVADIVACHHDIAINPQDPVSEKEVVYLADKRVAGVRVVPLEARFAAALVRYGANPDARVNIQRRKAQALAVQARIERAVGCPVDDLLQLTREDGGLR
ncbi:MAG: NTP transferase domain-containing protein [Desulfobacteraceae bacterium]|nr:NTP transferase domain-containing protein [Desulfobacteraceae bacterium]